MRVPLSWLKDFIDISDLDPNQLAETLTVAGLEVDAIEQITPPFTGVFVAKVLQTSDHPEAEKLKIARVTDGVNEYQVVCGAPNCRAGLVTAFAKVGAKFLDQEKPFKIKKSKIRGVESQGMLCSVKELCLGQDHEGIIELDSDYAEKIGEPFGQELFDQVFVISLTPNLAHCMSVKGVARELSALLSRPMNTYFQEPVDESVEHTTNSISISIEDQQACPLYTARLIQNVQVGPSPSWLKEKIERAGMRSINNVVDITNYCLLELGQPLHAFDYQRIETKKVTVRKAKNQENFTTLDGQNHQLTTKDLLICDGERPIALAGVMGGENSEVSEQTTDVLLESAYFSPKGISHTSRRLGLLTEAAARYSRGADPRSVLFALEKAALLLSKIAGGSVAKGVVQQGSAQIEDKKITIRLSATNQLLGLALVQGELESAIQRFDYPVQWLDEDTLQVAVPPFRHDLTQEVDLIEEVARIWGYDHLPTKMGKYESSSIPDSPLFSFQQQLRRRMVALGLHETLTSDLVGPDLIGSVEQQEGVIKVKNPTSVDQSVLRPSLLPGLLEVAAFNHRHGENDVSIFEIGSVYLQEGQESQEEPVVAFLGMGRRNPRHIEEEKKWDFFDVKGIVETLLSSLRVKNVSYEKSFLSSLHPGQQAKIVVGEIQCGIVGQLHPRVLHSFGITEKVFFFTLSIRDLVTCSSPPSRMKPLALYPSSQRDWTLSVDADLPVGKVVEAMSAKPLNILESKELISIYHPKEGGKRLTFRLTYRDKKKTLSQEVVDQQHARLVERVENFLQAESLQTID